VFSGLPRAEGAGATRWRGEAGREGCSHLQEGVLLLNAKPAIPSTSTHQEQGQSVGSPPQVTGMPAWSRDC